MKPEQQRIAIAEACGWTKEYIHGNGIDDEVWIHPTTQKCWLAELDVLPDYLNDLNEMHKAVESLRENQFHYVDYPRQLFKVVSGIEWTGDVGYFFFCLVNATATAAQRAEAFLRTLSLWVS